MEHKCDKVDIISRLEREVVILTEKIQSLMTSTNMSLQHLNGRFEDKLSSLIEKINNLEKFQTKLTWWIISLFTTSISTLVAIIIMLIKG